MRLTACFEEGILPEATSPRIRNFLKLHVFGLPGLRACARVAKAVQIHARRSGAPVSWSRRPQEVRHARTPNGGSAMLKRSCAFAVFCSVSFLMQACGSGTDTGTGGVAGMGGLSGFGGIGGKTNVAGATSIGACGATGGTTVVPFATTPGASVLVSPCARVAVTYTSASSNPGSYSPPSVPVGAECRPGISTYTLDLASQRLWWEDCSVVGDPQVAGSYLREVGSTCLSSSEFESARDALSLVTVSGEGQCWEYIGSFPATITMTMTSPAGSQMYGDEKSCGVAVGSEGLSDFEQILASLANAASSAGGSSSSCGTVGAGGS